MARGQWREDNGARTMTDTGPLFVSSGDLIADRRYQWALDLLARGDLAAAADLLAQAAERAPDFAAAWFTLGEVRDRLGDRDGAVAAFTRARDADPQDAQGAGLQLARLGGSEAIPAMPDAYVRRLFDQYAPRYDTALTGQLHYRGPAILRDAVERAASEARKPLHFDSVLDLGCGTGLAGAAFRPLAGRLVGVDLAPAMIANAIEKGIYDQTQVAKIDDFLGAAAKENARFDLVLAADVFVYVGDLAPIFAAIAAILARGGLLAFTAETHAGDGIKILPTLRFAHGEAHIRAVLAAHGLRALHLAKTSVRSEKSVPVEGLVVVAAAA
jgi:predicted TPR repeat methyltransferase